MKKHLINKSNLTLRKKVVLFFLCVVIATVSLFGIYNGDQAAATCYTSAECQAQIEALEDVISQYNAEAARLNDEAKTLQSTLAKLANEKAIIQSEIDKSQMEYNQLVIQIEDTEKKIKDSQDNLGKTIANMYVDDQITPLEMIAGSTTISDFMDKQEYRNSVRNELVLTIDRIKELKESLVTKKSEVEIVLGNQKNARQALVEKENEQQSILNYTKGQEAAYQQMSTENEAKKKELAEQQMDIIRRASGGNLISDPSKGNYPWGDNCYVGWDLMSYGGFDGDGHDPLRYACRQCTSYAAWKILEHTGSRYYYWGHANMWPGSARNYGLTVNSTWSANSVGVMMAGYYGHVVWVEREDPLNSNNIIISQFNSYYDNTGDDSGPGWGNYSKKSVPKTSYDYYIHF